MKMQSDSLGRVICGSARFTLLHDGLLRFEFDPQGRFDDRPTLRAMALPRPRPFDTVDFTEKGVQISAREFVLTYQDGPALTPDSLKISWKAGRMEGSWQWGQLDPENLGAITTLDHFYEAHVPDKGVHPAGSQVSERYGEMNLYQSCWNLLDMAKKHGIKLSKPVLWTAFRRYDELPEDMKREIDIWKRCPAGPISKSGYWTLDETGMCRLNGDDPDTSWPDLNVRKDYVDFYFGCYGRDFRLAMAQFSALLGKAPLLPRWAYGTWYSRYYAYTDKEFQNIVKQHEKHGIPLDVLIMDMDWHISVWNRWDWNLEKIPNPKEFCQWKEKAGIHIGLNLHDESTSREDELYKAFCENLGIAPDNRERLDEKADFEAMSESMGIRTRMPGHSDEDYFVEYRDPRVWEAFQKTYYEPNDEMGVDFWWQDNWQGLFPHINMNLWKLELMRRRHQKQGKRPMALNRYSGLGSHRYPAFFSGDTGSHWPVLKMLAGVNLRAAHCQMSYFSHDLGGFVGELFEESNGHISPELFVRWMQLGALAPIMRVHSNKGVRECWNYGGKVEEHVREAYLLHHALVPYFYQLCRENHDTGLPVIRPVYFEQPENEKGFDYTQEYFVGDKLFFSPIVEQGGFHTIRIPEGRYLHYRTGEAITGPVEISDRFHISFVPLYVKQGAVIPEQTYAKRQGVKLPDPLVFAVFPGGNDRLDYYEDDGLSQDYEESYTILPVTHYEEGAVQRIAVDPLQGSFKGMRTGRNLRFDFKFAAPKEGRNIPSVAVLTDAKGTREVPAEFDPRTGTVSVTLKNQSLKSPFELVFDPDSQPAEPMAREQQPEQEPEKESTSLPPVL